MKRLRTTWTLYTYDVWGNAKDGYDVNDVYSHGKVDIAIPQTAHNIGTPQEFVSAYPTERQIKSLFGVSCHIDLDGDDIHIEVIGRRDGYPIGCMKCISHESLSPVRAKGEERSK